MLHRIKGLGKVFVQFDDDVYLGKDFDPVDWWDASTGQLRFEEYNWRYDQCLDDPVWRMHFKGADHFKGWQNADRYVSRTFGHRCRHPNDHVPNTYVTCVNQFLASTVFSFEAFETERLDDLEGERFVSLKQAGPTTNIELGLAFPEKAGSDGKPGHLHIKGEVIFVEYNESTAKQKRGVFSHITPGFARTWNAQGPGLAAENSSPEHNDFHEVFRDKLHSMFSDPSQFEIDAKEYLALAPPGREELRWGGWCRASPHWGTWRMYV